MDCSLELKLVNQRFRRLSQNIADATKKIDKEKKAAVKGGQWVLHSKQYAIREKVGYVETLSRGGQTEVNIARNSQGTKPEPGQSARESRNTQKNEVMQRLLTLPSRTNRFRFGGWKSG